MTIWVDGRPHNDLTSVTTTTGQINGAEFRATVVPREEKKESSIVTGDMTDEQLVQFLKDYAVCNGIQDVYDAADALGKRIQYLRNRKPRLIT